MATEEKIERLLLGKLGTTGIRFLSLHLDLSQVSTPPDWIQGRDHLHRGVVLIGDESLGDSPEAAEVVSILLHDLAHGQCPEMVCPIACAPAASRAVVEAVSGPAEELLLHGERGTGKTIVELVIAMLLAKRHLHAGYPGPFRVLWLHDSLLSASIKTARSMELPMWLGCWTLHEDRRAAKFTLAGRPLIHVDFVGCADEASAQRLRASCHHVLAEELVPSLSDGVGITEAQYELALSSMRRQDTDTLRRVAVSSTNPGAPDSWAYRRFLASDHPPQTLAIRIPREDRLTPGEQAALDQSFASNLTLQRRLARGEWVMMELGASVAEGFDERIHVARTPLTPDPNYLLAIGIDGGHSPSAVVGQIIGGQIRVYAALNMVGVGMLQLIEQQLAPWLQEHAPWAVSNYGASLVCIIDPNLATPSQHSITESGEKIILDQLGGQMIHGSVRWPPRREAVLRTLRPGHEGGRVPLQISPGEETQLLVEAFGSRWFYPVGANGQVDRTGPKKPNSPWADVGDAAAYLFGWLLSGDSMEINRTPVEVVSRFNVGDTYTLTR